MTASTISHQAYTTFTRPSVASDLARNLARALLGWSVRHSRVVQISHEEMALRIANDRVVAEIHHGRNW
jgi:hypothetical protein